MVGKYIMIDLNDEKSKQLSEVLSNDTCKKILNFMSEKDEITESDISKSLNLPLNTVNYNMKKLLASHLVEEADHVLWSSKGKRIRIYRVSNKSIVISPRSRSPINKLLTAGITLASTFLLGLGVKFFFRQEWRPIEDNLFSTGEAAITTTQKAFASGTAENISRLASIISSIPDWGWLLIGSVLALVIVFLMNWRKL